MPDAVGISALAVAIAASAAAWLFARRVRRLEARLDAFLRGSDGKSLEAILAAHGAELAKHAAGLAEVRKASEYLHRALQAAVRKVGFERYNPFQGLGGNQSFTLVLLDAHNTGVVITALHNRDATRVYAKAVRDGTPLQQLSTEEERVLHNAALQHGA